MVITIHQPEHLIWLGLVDKISKADVFIVLDTVQFRKNYFQNRNRIRSKTEKGWTWITVPVKKHPLSAKIKDIKISYNQNWIERYLNLIKINYQKARFFSLYFPEIARVILKEYQYLSDLNVELIKFILKCFNVRVKIIRSSELNITGIKGGSNVVLEICKRFSGYIYLSGVSGREYLDLKKFKLADIKVIFHEFHHPIYKQLYNPFIPGMSSIDLLFNYGPESRNILRGKKTRYTKF